MCGWTPMSTRGSILRADTVRRDIGQVSARMGNMLVNRKRSG